MQNIIEQQLIQYKRKTITIDQLALFLPPSISYGEFAELILQLEKNQILEMVKSKGRNPRTPSLAYQYRIHHHQLKRSFYQLLQTYRHKFHDAINLDVYFSAAMDTWTEDLPYLERIDTYIKKFGFPIDKVPAPERSFEIVADEKWIEQGGDELLHRVQLWDRMNIFPVSDPLMFAVNPNLIAEKLQRHLIVENKTTYQALLPALIKSKFATLVYGSGNKIVKGIENFADQYPVEAEHIFYYFGDIDYAGITIWHSLSKRNTAIPARPFYKACLTKESVYGKTNQRKNETALDAFMHYFSGEFSEAVHSLLAKGAYYPQEVLKTNELQAIMLGNDWSPI